MASSIRLIVGLGNPGPEYEANRHNVGYRVADAVAERTRIELRRKGQSMVGWGKWRGRPLGVARPLTFMNRSGSAVAELVRKRGLSPEDILIVVDDLNLDVGRLRIRGSGGTGGHNGLQDILDELDSDAFARIRIGVGSDFPRGRQADYVLSDFSEDELKLIEPVTERATEAALTFVSDGLTTAMNRFSK
jgi:peptidyl-tRNA hydrolase, PTH1 family